MDAAVFWEIPDIFEPLFYRDLLTQYSKILEKCNKKSQTTGINATFIVPPQIISRPFADMLLKVSSFSSKAGWARHGQWPNIPAHRCLSGHTDPGIRMQPINPSFPWA
jgi:hypothetical protein